MGFDGDQMVNPSVGYLFPGQGAQYVGMGKDLYDVFASVKDVYMKADEILGYRLSRLCFEGSEEEITRTLYAQPAIFVTSFAALTVLYERCPEFSPVFVAGLSLGEFTALVAGRSLTFEDGLRLVSARAEAMEKAAAKNPGTMASIMGLSQEDCASVAKESGCQLANLNSPDQFVISGRVDAIEKACGLAESKGAKRAIRLKVGGAFHSVLMQDAKESLKQALAAIPIKRPSCVFIPNVTAEPTQDPEKIRSLLVEQLVKPVHWIETMAQAFRQNVPLFLEVGPGKVLKGLARKCQPSLNVLPCGTVRDMDQLNETFGKVRS